MSDDSDLLRPAEVAPLFGVDPKTIAKWARLGKLPSVLTLGGHRRFRRGEITRLLEEQGIPSEDTQ